MIQELEDYLLMDYWIIGDACPILAGYVPTEHYQFQSNPINPQYHRITDGKLVTRASKHERAGKVSNVGDEIKRVMKLWQGSSHRYLDHQTEAGSVNFNTLPQGLTWS